MGSREGPDGYEEEKNALPTKHRTANLPACSPVAIPTSISRPSHVFMHVTKYIKLETVEANVKLDLKETEYENVDWISLAQDRVRLPVLLYMVIKLHFAQKVR